MSVKQPRMNQNTVAQVKLSKITAEQAKKSLTKIVRDTMGMTPSSLITLFELDLSGIMIGDMLELRDRNVIIPDDLKIFRFHNSVHFKQHKIIWGGREYHPSPIMAEGFETNVRGTLPRPKLSLFVTDEFIKELDLLKSVLDIGELVGSKITRVRTFAKYLDAANFEMQLKVQQTDKSGNMIGTQTLDTGIAFDTESMPDGFEPDPYAEFPRDIYYIDKKAAETKQVLEFELSSAIDVENVRLPYRRVIANTCQFQYRGEGCMYEYGGSYEINAIQVDNVIAGGEENVYKHVREDSRTDFYNTLSNIYGAPSDSDRSEGTACRRNETEHGQLGVSKLPIVAPPVANDKDELIFTIKDEAGRVRAPGLLSTIQISQPVVWETNTEYIVGDVVLITKKGINYYFVAKVDVPANISPPNTKYWIADECSKSIRGCSIRWNRTYETTPGVGHLIGGQIGHLPFGGFPGVNKG